MNILVKMVRVGDSEVQSGIRKVTLEEYDDAVDEFKNSNEQPGVKESPVPMNEHASTADAEERSEKDSLKVNAPSTDEKRSVMPNFIKLAADSAAQKTRRGRNSRPMSR